MHTGSLRAKGGEEAEQLFQRYFPGIVMNGSADAPFEAEIDEFAGEDGLTMSEHTISGPMTVQVDATSGFTIAMSQVVGELGSGREVIDVSQPWVVPRGQTAKTVFTRTRMLTVPVDAFDRFFRATPGKPASGPFAFTGLAPRSAAYADYWRSTLATVRQAMTSGAVDDPILSRSLTEYVIAAALVSFPHNWQQPEANATATPTAALRRAKAFIDDHAHEPIALADVAEAARLSPRHLQTEFRRSYDTTPMAYLRRARLDLARDALLRLGPADGESVTRIARACGFAHLGRFAAAYREAFGEYPRQTLTR